MANNTLHVERARRRLTQREAAEFLGIPFWRYYHIERGWKAPTHAEATRMAKRLKTTPEVLFPSDHASEAVSA